MLARTTSPTIASKRGRLLSVTQCLVDKNDPPKIGWSVFFPINGVRLKVSGRSPEVVIQELTSLLKANKIEASLNELWTTLNMIWLERAEEKKRLVDVRSFLDIVVSSPSSDFTGKVPLTEWTDSMLSSLGYYLSTDPQTYSHNDLVSLMERFVTLANPSSSYRTGDARLFSSLLEKREDLRYKPRHLLEDAKDWFTTTYNSVASITGASSLTRETITTKYHWFNDTTDR